MAYGVGKCALDRLTADTALELAAHGVSVVSLWPGFVRTERIDVAVGHGLLPDTLDVDSAESPRFTGRGVVALATDPDVSRWSGPSGHGRATWPRSTASATSTTGSLPGRCITNRRITERRTDWPRQHGSGGRESAHEGTQRP